MSPRVWGQLRGDGEEASDDGSEARDIPTVQPLSEADLLLLEWLPDDGEAGGEALEESCFPAFPPECKRLCARQALDYLLETHKISRESLIALICGIDPLPLQRLDLDQLLREPSSALLRIDLAHLLSYENFCILSDPTKDALLALLPDVDRTSPEAVRRLFAFDPIFSQARANFSERLGLGQFRHGAQQPSASPPQQPQWKADFEAAWGQSAGRALADHSGCTLCNKPLPCGCSESLFEYSRARSQGALRQVAGEDLSSMQQSSPKRTSPVV